MPSFSGSLDELKDRLLIAGIDGEWVEGGSGVWQLRCPDGANLNWSSTRGTIWCQGKQPAKSALEAKIAGTLETSFETTAKAARAATPASRTVFVVYGHDEPARTSLEAMLRRWDLEPLILDQLTSGGQTIIEKLESVRKEANFAVVLATPDDAGNRQKKPQCGGTRALRRDDPGWGVGSS